MSIAVSGLGNSYQPPEFTADSTTSRNYSAYRAKEQERAQIISNPDLDTVAKDLERLTLAFNRKLRFSVNQETDEVVVKVVDSETDKVIKEIPAEELQRLHQKLKEMIGLLFDEKA